MTGGCTRQRRGEGREFDAAALRKWRVNLCRFPTDPGRANRAKDFVGDDNREGQFAVPGETIVLSHLASP
jgi:hypothetical protein